MCWLLLWKNEDSFAGWTSLWESWRLEYRLWSHPSCFRARKKRKERKKKRRMTRMKREASLTSEMRRRDFPAIVHTIHLSIFITRTDILHCKLSRFFSQGIICYTVVHIVCDRRTNIEWLLMNTTTWPVLTRKYEQVTTKSEERNSKESEKNAYTSTIRFDE